MNALLLTLLFQLAGPAQQAQALVGQAPVDTSVAVSIHARIWPDTVYVGQQALYQLIVFVDERSRDRVRRMEAIPPEMRGMMAYEAPQRSGLLPTRVIGRRRFEPYVYQRPVFPVAAGELVIPPSRLVYAMPVSPGFFSRVESMELWSDSTRVFVREPPADGQPSSFRGAVGRLSVAADLDTGGARVGDPLVLTVRVRGEGNVKLFPRPELEIAWASAVPAGESVQQGRDSLLIGGTKEFRWVLTPRSAGVQRLPPIQYPYFDPSTSRYEIAATRPRTVTIAPGALARVDTEPRQTRPVWPIRTTFRGSLPEPPHRSAPFWAVILLAPLPALVVALRRRPRRGTAITAPRGGEALNALDPARASAADVRRAFLRASSERLRVPAVTLGEPAEFDRSARRTGVTHRTAREAAALVAELNAAAFGRDRQVLRDALARARRLYARLDAEAVRRFRRATPVALVLLTVLLPAGASLALANAGERERFDAGVAAYDRGEYAVAARMFEDVAVRVPRAADAWANLGTSAWVAADTARAAWGWQRALRLEPHAGDVRSRIIVLGDQGASGRWAVPPLPVAPISLLAAALWVIGWSASALLAWRGRTLRSPALAVIGVAFIAGVAAASIDHRLAAADLAVVARTEPLRLLPALGADRDGRALVGMLALIVERRGGWVRVVSADDRTGWLERDALLTLARD